tara:strand:+ start:3302 stop:3523 length:222 start_codon:yes stop_codon:yes gene_type:complete
MIGINWSLRLKLMKEKFDQELDKVRAKNSKLQARNKHLERRLHAKTNDARRRGSSRPKALPTEKKICKVFRIY